VQRNERGRRLTIPRRTRQKKNATRRNGSEARDRTSRTGPKSMNRTFIRPYLAAEGFLPGYNFRDFRCVQCSHKRQHPCIDRPRFLDCGSSAKKLLYHEAEIPYASAFCQLWSAARLKRASSVSLRIFHEGDQAAADLCNHCKSTLTWQIAIPSCC